MDPAIAISFSDNPDEARREEVTSQLDVPHDGLGIPRRDTSRSQHTLALPWLSQSGRALFHTFAHPQTRDEHSRDDQHPAVTLSRVLLPMLAAVGTFGAAVSFGTLFQAHGQVGDTALGLMAWAWTSFIFGVALCIIWHIALAADFRDGLPGRAFRNTIVIFSALMSCCLSMFAGALCLSLALVYDAPKSVQMAGLAAVFLLSAVCLLAAARLTVTVWRRVSSPSRYTHIALDTEAGRHQPQERAEADHTGEEIKLSIHPADGLESTRRKNEQAIAAGKAETVVLEGVEPLIEVATESEGVPPSRMQKQSQ